MLCIYKNNMMKIIDRYLNLFAVQAKTLKTRAAKARPPLKIARLQSIDLSIDLASPCLDLSHGHSAPCF